MRFRYREHLIFPVAYLDPVIGDWTASVHIEFTEKAQDSYNRLEVRRCL